MTLVRSRWFVLVGLGFSGCLLPDVDLVSSFGGGGTEGDGQSGAGNDKAGSAADGAGTSSSMAGMGATLGAGGDPATSGSGGTMSDSGDMVSQQAVKDTLKHIVEDEPKENPYSDDQLVEELSKRGVHIARRTVTKYRKALGIDSSSRRKQF